MAAVSSSVSSSHRKRSHKSSHRRDRHSETKRFDCCLSLKIVVITLNTHIINYNYNLQCHL